MAKKLFKGFQQVTEGNFSAQNGYLYLVRNSANTGATDGYLLFNGKKYGTAAEAAAALNAKIGTLPEGYDNLVSYINAQVTGITENYATKVELGTLSGRVDALEAIDADTRLDAIEALSAGTRLNTLEAVSADTRLDAIEALSAGTRLSNLETSAHTHENKAVLDGISAEKVAAWDALAEGAQVVLSSYTGSDAGVTEGYLKTYEIFQGGTSVGKIDIPKDLVVTSGQIVEENGVKYLRLTIANQDAPVDIAVTDLVDVYTPGNGIEISGSNEVSAKVVEANGLSVGSNGIALALADGDNNGALSAADFTKLGTIEASAQTNVIETIKVDGTALTVTDKAVDIVLPDYTDTYAPKSLTGTVETNRTDFNNYTATTDGRLDALEADTHTHENKAVLDGITAEKVAAWDGVAGSADTRIAALEAIDADTRLDAIEALSAGTRLNALEAVSADTRLDALEALTATTDSALQSISAADASVSVSAKANNAQTVGVALSRNADNALSLENDGLFAAIYYDGDDSN